MDNHQTLSPGAIQKLLSLLTDEEISIEDDALLDEVAGLTRSENAHLAQTAAIFVVACGSPKWRTLLQERLRRDAPPHQALIENILRIGL